MNIELTCREIKAQLSDYIDGELDSSLCAQLERHLEACPDCRIVVDTLHKTILLYRHYGRTPTPAGFQERLLLKLALDNRTRV